jgi:hypothetical protein
MRLVSDDLVAGARLVATRAVTIAAPPNSVFPWLRQMGFGRGGWYSYDWIGNLGRHSACSILPEWQDVGTGDVIPEAGRCASRSWSPRSRGRSCWHSPGRPPESGSPVSRVTSLRAVE